MTKRIITQAVRTANHPSLIKHCGGFTLLELIASLVLLGLLAAIFGMGIVAAIRSYEFSRTNVQLAQKGQLAMTRISRELMEMTGIEAISSTSQDPFIIYTRYPVNIAQPESRMAIHFDSGTRTVRIYSNLNPSIRAPLDSSSIGQGDILVDGVSGFALDYLQGVAGAFWTWGSDTRLLSSIRITLRLSRPDNARFTQDFSTLVHLRNTENYGGAAPAASPRSRNDYSCFISAIMANG